MSETSTELGISMGVAVLGSLVAILTVVSVLALGHIRPTGNGARELEPEPSPVPIGRAADGD